MSSHIDCDDLLALAACSVDEQLNADLRNQLSMSLLCHIAQAGAANNTHAPAFAPATTPTASSFQNSSSNAWISDDSFYNPYHQARRTRESSVARAQSRYQRMDDSEGNDEGDNMQIEQDDVVSSTFLPLDGEPSRVIGSGKQPGELMGPPLLGEGSEAPSLFATSDPFYLAVQDLQAASRCRRQLQPKLFSVNTPLQVTPNPVQFGTLNVGTQFGAQNNAHHAQGFGSRFGNSGYDPLDRRGPSAIPIDASLLQYR